MEKIFITNTATLTRSERFAVAKTEARAMRQILRRRKLQSAVHTPSSRLIESTRRCKRDLIKALIKVCTGAIFC